MTNAYTESKDDIAASYRRIHANDERTHVYILSCGESAYVALAADVDPIEYQAVAAELIAFSPTLDAAHEHAQRWMETHSRGIAGEDNNSGFLKTMLTKLNSYGEELAEQQQQTNEGEN